MTHCRFLYILGVSEHPVDTVNWGDMMVNVVSHMCVGDRRN